jgi:hypothetical protein
MAATRLQKWCLLFGCTFALLTFQNCAQSFESAKNASQVASSGSDPTNPEVQPPTSQPTTPTAPPTTTPTTPPPVMPPTTPPPANGMVNAFMATGHVGRTVFSCDDGRTWIHDRSDNNNTRCWVDGNPNYVECDHTVNSGRGVDAGDGWFIANFGWGFNGSVRRSRDGVNWQTVISDGWGGGVSLLDGYVYVSWRDGIVSPDLGVTWQNHPNSPKRNFEHPWIVRSGDVIAMIGRPTGANKISFSFNGGRNWSLPAALQSERWIKTFVEGAGRLVVVGHSENPTVSYSAISDNNGASWMIRQQGGIAAPWTDVFYDGTRFVTFASGRRYVSNNGLDWTSAPLTVAGMSAASFEGPISFDPSTGTYVRILGVWGNFYDRQKAFRSTDGGLTWQTLSATAFRGGHPIRDITLGVMEEAYCR